MFCIAAFIVLLIISIFSAKYRSMVKKAWGCVGRRVTLRPCDSTFKEDLKNHMLAKVAVRKPKWVKAADIAIEVGAIIIVLLTIWSLYVLVKSGLNLYVYGTCNPKNAASCSLGAEACSIDTVQPSFYTSVKTFKVHEWVGNEVSGFVDTVQAVPSRLRDWKAQDYLTQNVSYARPFNESLPTALEIIDPGCQFCNSLYQNIKQSTFLDRYNLTYIAYPIPDSTSEYGYKFRHSYTIVKYLEALRIHPLENADITSDWQLLDIIFTGNDEKGYQYQQAINSLYDDQQMTDKLAQWILGMGYTQQQLDEIIATSQSEQVKQIIEANGKIVTERIDTVKIPTIIYNGQRHGGVKSVEDLNQQ
jgi:hypothetical protein